MPVSDLFSPDDLALGRLPALPPSSEADVLGGSYQNMRDNFTVNASARLTSEEFSKRDAMINERFGALSSVIKPKPEAMVMGGRAGEVFVPDRMYPQIDEWIMKGRQENPDQFKDILTSDEVRESARKRAQQSAAEYGDIMSRYTRDWAGTLSFVGGIAGSFTDPLNLATLPFGAGMARGILETAAIEGVLNAGIELASTPFIAQWQHEIGAKYGVSEALTDIGLGFAGGAAIGGTIRAAVPAFNFVREATGSVSQLALSRIANMERLPQSVRDAAEYMSRVAHIDESLPPTKLADLEADPVKTMAEHRMKANDTAKKFENYEKPVFEEAKVETPSLFEAQSIKQEFESKRYLDPANPKSVKKALDLPEAPKRVGARILELGGISTGLTNQERGNVRSVGKSTKTEMASDMQSVFGGDKKLVGRYIRQNGKGLDELARELADEGYIAGKDGQTAQPSDLISLLERDGFDAYPVDIQERIYDHLESQSMFDEMVSRAGINLTDTIEEIAAKLEAERSYSDPTRYSHTSPENTPPLETPVDIPENQRYAASKADFDRLLLERGDTKIEMDDGRVVTLKELADELAEDEAAINAMKVCAIG